MSLFRKQLVILLGVTLVFAGIAMFISDAAVRAMMSWSSKEDTTGGPTQGIVRLIDALTEDRTLTLDEAVRRIDRSGPGPRAMRIQLVDANGLREKLGLNDKAIPEDPFQAYTIREKELRFPRFLVFRAKADPSRFIIFERGEMPPPLPGAGGPPPPPGHHGPPPIFIWTFGALVLSGFFAAAISLFLLFSSMRRKARLAADVIQAIKQGDWRKRMPIDSVDEVSHLMQEFNRMADEIEFAVRSMQRAETSRTNLLQELAHDLRTPIASLRGLIETLEIRNAKLDENARAELFGLAQKEIDYFARLVEDLLFLAQVRDPRYLNSGKIVDVAEILREQVDRTRADGDIEIITEGVDNGTLQVRGDEVLLKRMIRNAVDNAVSFARKKVVIRLHDSTIAIQDDGPGFSDQALKTFGEKRFSRFLGEQHGDRLSVGLGSVIMATVCHVHGGKINAANLEHEGRRLGAEVRIELPRT